jgi:hypothetical protein
MALIALASLDLECAAGNCGEVLSLSSNGDGAAEVFDAFIQRKNGAALLAKSLADRKLPPDAA